MSSKKERAVGYIDGLIENKDTAVNGVLEILGQEGYSLQQIMNILYSFAAACIQDDGINENAFGELLARAVRHEISTEDLEKAQDFTLWHELNDFVQEFRVLFDNDDFDAAANLYLERQNTVWDWIEAQSARHGKDGKIPYEILDRIEPKFSLRFLLTDISLALSEGAGPQDHVLYCKMILAAFDWTKAHDYEDMFQEDLVHTNEKMLADIEEREPDEIDFPDLFIDKEEIVEEASENAHRLAVQSVDLLESFQEYDADEVTKRLKSIVTEVKEMSSTLNLNLKDVLGSEE